MRVPNSIVENDEIKNQNEWNGFAQTVKKYTKKLITLTHEMVMGKISSLDAKVDSLEAKIDTVEAKIDTV